MRNSKLLYLAFALILLLGVLNYIAGLFYFYWTLFWFDNMMHFLAGLGGGLVVVWFYSKQNLQNRKIFLKTFITLMLVGIVWEIFEYTFGIAQQAGENYTVDTFSDLLMDALGAISAYLLVLKNYEQN